MSITELLDHPKLIAISYMYRNSTLYPTLLLPKAELPGGYGEFCLCVDKTYKNITVELTIENDLPQALNIDIPPKEADIPSQSISHLSRGWLIRSVFSGNPGKDLTLGLFLRNTIPNKTKSIVVFAYA